jgi:hypothetical protein
LPTIVSAVVFVAVGLMSKVEAVKLNDLLAALKKAT